MASQERKPQSQVNDIDLQHFPAASQWHDALSKDRDDLARVQKKQMITVCNLPTTSQVLSILSQLLTIFKAQIWLFVYVRIQLYSSHHLGRSYRVRGASSIILTGAS